uniref:uncharacterized protein LOC122604595 n=1 Tax=Erigeron canadensis TaxID=72917 RepID=UPI001CB9BFAB|nr:uncharacterized protein LOC122604595 [Erigeron canadensis]
MIRLESIREKSSRWEHEVSPAIRKKLDVIKSQRSDWMTIHVGGNKFEVRNHRYAYSLDMDMGTCDCRMWQMSGIPYVHTMQAIYKMNKNPEDFVAIWFRKVQFDYAYEFYLNPVGGMDTWNSFPHLNVPLPPRPRTMPGRPKKKKDKGLHMSQRCVGLG